MGVYDSFVAGDRDVQLKCGPCETVYRIDDTVNSQYCDGLYAGYGGIVVIVGGKFVALFEELHDKWGGVVPVDINHANPIAQRCRAYR